MKLKWPLMVLTLCGFLLANLSGLQPVCAAADPVIKWYSYSEGMAQGRKEKKKVLIYFWAEWCAYCAAMDRDTLTDKALVDYLNANFIAIRVNYDRETDVVAHFQVRGLPNTYFLTEQGEALSNLPGLIPANVLLGILKYLHTDSYKHMSFREFFKSD